ncbi:von Willebrand factor A domain-containing protein 3A-like isoform X1 [Hydractinia symbiolongicarpus]|uniref:von Willebrand factor A domain-containing protein 3A-like isoform X1 n=1 Tax=Hydractinia symbiolongicarpus TaxID=13093 RepID=UPI00254DD4AB|nr:von Willebrand factor A domain-containing protein 3A-like isoform X1 [Hydractinia symbiolongicarpus]
MVAPRTNVSRKKDWSPSDVQDAKNYYNKTLASKSTVRYGESNQAGLKYKQALLPQWSKDFVNSFPPNDLTVTNVSQSYHLSTVHDIEVARSEDLTSKEWLKQHGLEAQDITVENIFKHGSPLPSSTGSVEDDEYFKFQQHTLQEFQSKINHLICTIEERIRWLLTDSRKVFGNINGERTCVLIDASDINLAFGRLPALQESLKLLLKEQLSKKCKLIMASFGTVTNFSWDILRSTNNSTMNEAEHWVEFMTPSGSCNAMHAIKRVLKQKDIDSIVFILGNSPDQNTDVLLDYTVESLSGRNVLMHTVAYNCQLKNTKMFLEDLAMKTNGRYHCYSYEDEEEIMQGTDLMSLSHEIKRAKQILLHLEDLKNGNSVGSKAIACIEEPSHALIEADYHQKQQEKLNKIDEEYYHLKLEKPSIPIRTSKEWLKSFGLKAKGLTLYQVMAPNVYSYVSSYVSTLNKQIESRIHHQSMIQMDWYDGSVKNVHVDPVILFNYQHHLQAALNLYRKRLNWLNEDSRKTFGTIVQKKIVILVDMSIEAQLEIGELLLSVKHLLEQQLSNKTLFNLVCLGERVLAFKSMMVEPTHENLTACWKWLSERECSGAKKILPGLRFILENEEERKQSIDVDGIYFISTGTPEENEDVVSSYISESFVGTEMSFNCIYFQPMKANLFSSEMEHASKYLKKLAHQNNGRFHWVDSKVAVESDDIRLIAEEMNKASNYLTKSQLLLDKMKSKQDERNKAKADDMASLDEAPHLNRKNLSRSTINKPRMEFSRPKSAVVASLTKKKKSKPRPVSSRLTSTPSIAWRPNSVQSGSLIPAVPTPVPGKKFKDITERIVYEDEKPAQQIFYTEVGNSTGSVFRYNPRPTCQKKKAPIITPVEIKIPDHEEQMSSKDWIHRYGLTKHKLDLNLIISATDSCRSSEKVSTIKKTVHARYCDIFPSVELNGSVHHLHLQVNDLVEFEKRVEIVLKRCTKRLKWLLQGSRSVFGTVIESNVVLILDTSGSMVSYMSDLKKQLVSLIWEQLHKQNVNFNLVQYSSNVLMWQDTLVEATKENCEQAIDWLQRLQSYGETATLEALQTAFHAHKDAQAFYLLTDGRPDSSTTMVLREAANLNMDRRIKIHTISFNCDDSSANTFLQMLSAQSKGRYHRFVSNILDADCIQDIIAEDTAQTKNAALFEGDDLKLILKEINMARKFLLQSLSYRLLLEKHSKKSDHFISNDVRVAVAGEEK